MGALVIKKMAFDSGVQGLWLPGINATVLQNRDGAAEVISPKAGVFQGLRVVVSFNFAFSLWDLRFENSGSGA